MKIRIFKEVLECTWYSEQMSSSIFNAASATAVQLAALPGSLWHMISERKLPSMPTGQDKSSIGIYSAIGGLIATGSSVLSQNIQAKGMLAAMTGAKLGLSSINWGSLGTALATGAAIGASIGIATYLSRQGYKSKSLSEERDSSLSATNVDLDRIRQKGMDAWAVNRVLDKDPKKGMERIAKANSEYCIAETHGDPIAVKGFAAVSLGAGILQPGGSTSGERERLKNKWLQEIQPNLNDQPGAQALLKVLPDVGVLRDGASTLGMHTQWVNMANDYALTKNADAFKHTFTQWQQIHFKNAESSKDLMVKSCMKAIEPIANSSTLIEALQKEASVVGALMAGASLGTRVEPIVLPNMLAPKYLDNTTSLNI